MGEPKKIERLYAWICTDPGGEDGVPAILSDTGLMPMVGADKVRIEGFRDAAMIVAKQGQQIRLVEFTRMVVLETHPGSGPA